MIRNNALAAFRIAKACKRSSSASFHRMYGLEMIVNHIGCHNLEETENGAGMLCPEVSEQPAVIGTKFQVGLLNQVVEQTRVGFAPASRGAQDDGRDQWAEASDKFRPDRFIFGRKTSSNQLIRR